MGPQLDESLASPLTPSEFLAATMVMSLFKVTAVSMVMSLCAWLFYGYNVCIIGLWLIPVHHESGLDGMIIGVFTTSSYHAFPGQEAEVLAWSMVIFLQPTLRFIRMDVLPVWLRVWPG
ncbi:MAG: hypothetical protein MRJ92_07930 [Nitrospira sp.]|nr:hypothetical protein [Nitrospira sp.]